MKDNRFARSEELNTHKLRFTNALSLAVKVFGEDAFRLPGEEGGRGKLSRPLFDGEMIALDRLADRAEQIEASAKKVKDAVISLAQPSTAAYELIVARANTAAAIKDRIDAVENAIVGAL